MGANLDFYLGTHLPNWMQKTRMPLFISYLRLRSNLRGKRRRPFQLSKGSVALDSGGFSVLSTYGKYPFTYKEYADDVRVFGEEIGHLDWPTIMDWMCEPFMLKITGKTVDEHQDLTVQSYLDLKSYAPEIAWTPVLQGWKITDYWRHVDKYVAAGIALHSLPRVGVGSICRRQATAQAESIIKSLASDGLLLHGFGLKIGGLKRVGDYLASADSMAWSFTARREQYKRPDCVGHKNCANCLPYALEWLEKIGAILADLPKEMERTLFAYV